MSLATSEPQKLKFLARFEHVWASLRRTRSARAWLVVPGGGARPGRAWRRPITGWNCPGTRGRPVSLALAAVTLAVLWGRVISPVAVVDQAANRRRDREPVPSARPAHPDRRPVRRAPRGADPLRRA